MAATLSTPVQAYTTTDINALYIQANEQKAETGTVATDTAREIIEASFATDSPEVMSDIAKCETDYVQYDKSNHVIRGVINPGDFGIFQINIEYWKKDIKDMGINPYTLSGNIELAKHIKEVQGLSAWEPSMKCWGKLEG